MSEYILAIDQGTTSSRALVFDRNGRVLATAQHEFPQYFPQNGWVEHDLNDIWQTTLEVSQEAISNANVPVSEIRAIGISNQRETTCVWHKETGQPLYNAIVWQDRRTAARCEVLKAEGLEALVAQKTGLLLDPYFSATKLAWILDNVPGVRVLAEQGLCLFGTIDTFLLWHFTSGKAHSTDATNASRTALFNIHTQCWDADLLKIFNIPSKILPEVKDTAGFFGKTDSTLFGHAIPITSLVGDQQAALIGQACIRPGMIKCTYGTGCFLVVNTGEVAIQSSHRLLTTTAYRIQGKVNYALEGSIFMAGAAIQWLRDGLKILHSAKETESMARSVPDNGGVVVVPAFTGLGAPYWDPTARGAILGLTRDTSSAHIVRATLEAICFGTRDLLEAIRQDYIDPLTVLRVDGGMVANAWFDQALSDILALPITKPRLNETTAFGAAFLAGLGVGMFGDLSEIEILWHQEALYVPVMAEDARQQLYSQWLQAVARICTIQT